MGSDGNNFKMEIYNSNPLTRDFTCSPEPVLSMSLNSGSGRMVAVTNQFHPFIKGVASFTVTDQNTGKDKYPRQVYYGNEDTPQNPLQCDNSGVVLIKGNIYKVDFWK